jgi:CIC family chloride channel protein
VTWRHRLHLDRENPVLLALVAGVVTGFAVAGLERLAIEVLWGQLERGPVWLRIAAPAVGIGLAAAVLRLGGRLSPATADDYIANMHEPTALATRPAPWRLLGALCTIGTGNPGGLEGPSIYLGASIGSALDHRMRRSFHRDKAVMVAGAAAGVAAIFKAPATGVVFALEVPYRDDFARRSLIPALVGAASGYTAFVIVMGTRPLFSFPMTSTFHTVELFTSITLGMACGLLAHGLARAVGAVKARQRDGRLAVSLTVAAVVMVAAAAIGHAVYHRDLALTPGYAAVQWALDPRHSVAAVAGLMLLRFAGLLAVFRGGGVTGVFVPLVVLGALAGRVAAGLTGDHNIGLFVVLGMAATLGAGYRVPLAAVMFVAETTGRESVLVPALLATVAAQFMMGSASVSKYQQSTHARVDRRGTSAPH